MKKFDELVEKILDKNETNVANYLRMKDQENMSADDKKFYVIRNIEQRVIDYFSVKIKDGVENAVEKADKVWGRNAKNITDLLAGKGPYGNKVSKEVNELPLLKPENWDNLSIGTWLMEVGGADLKEYIVDTSQSKKGNANIVRIA